MTEQELKTILQAVLDGKVIQYKRVDLGIPQEFTDFPKCNITTLLRTALCGTNMLFRVKPEVKTYKYKTRPYSTSISLGVWTSVGGDEKEFEGWLLPLDGFKWLAEATEHEVEYE